MEKMIVEKGLSRQFVEKVKRVGCRDYVPTWARYGRAML
jgi:hypothetical protein